MFFSIMHYRIYSQYHKMREKKGCFVCYLLLGPHGLFGGGGGGGGFGSDTEDTVKLIRIEKQNKSKIQKWQYFFSEADKILGSALP